MACSQTLLELTSSSSTSLGAWALKDQQWCMFQHHHLHQTIYYNHVGVQCWEFLPWEVNPRKPLWV